MREEALRMDRVTYIEQDVKLLDNFNFQIYTGEIMGLIPIDSFGLDALIQLLQTNRPILYGYIYLKEQLVNTYQAKFHTDNNVQVLSHESGLVNYMSAEENVFILRRGYRGFMVKKKMLRQQLQMIYQELELPFSADTPLERMTLLERYIVELIKITMSSPELIVIQDPESIVNLDDLNCLHRILQYYSARGMTFLYISVHQAELAKICSRVALMANGEIVRIVEPNYMTAELVEKYQDTPFLEWNYTGTLEHLEEEIAKEKEEVFWCRDLYYKNIKGLNFSVEKGECLVIHDYGSQVSDNFVQILCGETPEKGAVSWKGNPKSPEYVRDIAVILENPASSMVYEHMSCVDNLCLTVDHRLSGMWRRSKTREKIAREVMREDWLNKKCQIRDLTIRQKYQLVYTRILLQRPKAVFCIRPFLNVDVQLREYIQSLMRQLLGQNIAVVIIGVDFRDAIQLANRLLLVKAGKNHGILEWDEFQYLSEVLSREK